MFQVPALMKLLLLICVAPSVSMPPAGNRDLDHLTEKIQVDSRVCHGHETEYGECDADVTPKCKVSCKPQDCEFGPWGKWMDIPGCVGLAHRARQVAKQKFCGGKPCTGPTHTTKESASAQNEGCKQKLQDCQFGSWGAWSDTCANATSLNQAMRQRKVAQNATFGGNQCTGPLKETKPCSEPEIRDCKLEPWNEWSKCTQPCGRGMRFRNRTGPQMHPNTPRGEPCNGNLSEEEPCNVESCANKTDCQLFDWSDWAACSGNARERTRKVVEAQNGGVACVSTAIAESGRCPPKQAECDLGDWSPWSNCTKECGGGQTYSHRKYTGVCQEFGVGNAAAVWRTQGCNMARCSQEDDDCQFSDWAPWLGCSASCGKGFRTRSRMDGFKKQASKSGLPCKGRLKETEECLEKKCTEFQPVDCKWEEWSNWGNCTASCGGGTHQRQRAIDTLPRNGGKECPASGMTQVAPCNVQSCEPDCEDGTWTSWESWTACTATCGSSYKSRKRTEKSDANHCGYPAHGLREMFVPCTGQPPCTTDDDCALSSWSNWDDCSGCFGVKYKKREIVKHANGKGKACGSQPLTMAEPCMPGAAESVPKKCQVNNATVSDCKLGTWSDWDDCSATCGGGQMKRSRTIERPAQNNGKPCSPVLAETTGCNTEKCDKDAGRDCTITAWTDWGGCGHQRQRYRSRRVGCFANALGKQCEAKVLRETSFCKAKPANINYCSWQTWLAWSDCGDDDCPSDKRRRDRSLQLRSDHRGDYLFKTDSTSSATCFGSQTEYKPCPTGSKCGGKKPAPVDCQMTPWQPWSPGDGSGLCSRSRTIEQKANQFGKQCGTQNITITKACPAENKKVDCVLSQWSKWTKCNDPEDLSWRSRAIATNPANEGKLCNNSLRDVRSCSAVLKPQDCKFLKWQDWTDCNLERSVEKTCGVGYRERMRSSRPGSWGGQPCNGSLHVLERCEVACKGKQDCKFEDWENWGTCDANLQKYRTRKMQLASPGGKACIGETSQIDTCTLPAAVDCKINSWQPWTACSKNCLGGSRSRNRTMDTPKHHGKDCNGTTVLSETIACGTGKCPEEQDCVWDGWSEWGKCSQTCGVNGQQDRSRKYTGRRVDGVGCNGSMVETRACADVKPCTHKDCKWSDWKHWSSCSKTCGPGQTGRTRTLKQAPWGKYAAACSVEVLSEIKSCTMGKCPDPAQIDGEWGPWEEWTVCTATCGDGVQWRARNISKEANMYGQPATGPFYQFANCKSDAQCLGDKDCEFGTWREWSACTSTCDGIQRRARVVMQNARGHGKACTDSTEEIKPCNLATNETGCPVLGIPIDCKYSAWSTWTACGECQGGQQSQFRSVVQESRHGGKACDSKDLEHGALRKTRGCSSKGCKPVEHKVTDCQWAKWNVWSACTICGGQRSRTRAVSVTAKWGGEPCDHKQAEETGKCPTHCGDKTYCAWADWGEWSKCSVPCLPNENGDAASPAPERRRMRHLKAHTVKAGSKGTGSKANASSLYEDGGDMDMQVQELYRKMKQGESARLKEVLAAFVMGCLSLLAVAALVSVCGRARKTVKTTRRIVASGAALDYSAITESMLIDGASDVTARGYSRLAYAQVPGQGGATEPELEEFLE